ncbi:uncharacterized protein N7503_006522 [Penicillium pulvis]|uniref:uncharacterized protein n=1 Tax=Penicillium pulvis TaxID=1562058 RepID=UPI002548E77B|nr:uncharacterized protein N7503_006522 [Penicillium pulvis]KAJ5799017.1 hypothetical protein N7503_006522 [Penicillium pulvis]
MLIQRQYCFEGSDAAYIKHLEARVSDLEKRHSETPQQFRLVRCETCREAPKTHEKGSISRLSDVGMRGQESVGRHGAERRIEQQQSTPSNSEPLNSTSSEGTSFNIVVWDPLGDPKPRSRKTNGEYDQTQAKLFKDFVGLTSNLPTTSDWKIGNSERATYHWGNISAFKLNLPTGLKQPSVLPLTHSSKPAPISSPLISPSVPICTSVTIGYPRTSIETLLTGYINVPKVSEKKNANFRKLVLCSACLVAMETTHASSKDDVYEILRRIFESDANISWLQSLCRGAKWIT